MIAIWPLLLYNHQLDPQGVLVTVQNGAQVIDTFSGDGQRRPTNAFGTLFRFVWDEENLLLWTDQSLALQNQMTRSPGEWGGLVSQRPGGRSFFYGVDLTVLNTSQTTS